MITEDIKVSSATFRREGFKKFAQVNMSRRYVKNALFLLLVAGLSIAGYTVFLSAKKGIKRSGWHGHGGVNNMLMGFDDGPTEIDHHDANRITDPRHEELNRDVLEKRIEEKHRLWGNDGRSVDKRPAFDDPWGRGDNEEHEEDVKEKEGDEDRDDWDGDDKTIDDKKDEGFMENDDDTNNDVDEERVPDFGKDNDLAEVDRDRVVNNENGKVANGQVAPVHLPDNLYIKDKEGNIIGYKLFKDGIDPNHNRPIEDRVRDLRNRLGLPPKAENVAPKLVQSVTEGGMPLKNIIPLEPQDKKREKVVDPLGAFRLKARDKKLGKALGQSKLNLDTRLNNRFPDARPRLHDSGVIGRERGLMGHLDGNRDADINARNMPALQPLDENVRSRLGQITQKPRPVIRPLGRNGMNPLISDENRLAPARPPVNGNIISRLGHYAQRQRPVVRPLGGHGVNPFIANERHDDTIQNRLHGEDFNPIQRDPFGNERPMIRPFGNNGVNPFHDQRNANENLPNPVHDNQGMRGESMQNAHFNGNDNGRDQSQINRGRFDGNSNRGSGVNQNPFVPNHEAFGGQFPQHEALDGNRRIDPDNNQLMHPSQHNGGDFLQGEPLNKAEDVNPLRQDSGYLIGDNIHHGLLRGGSDKGQQIVDGGVPSHDFNDNPIGGVAVSPKIQVHEEEEKPEEKLPLRIENINEPLPMVLDCNPFLFPPGRGTLCVHDPVHDSALSAVIKKEGLWEPNMLAEFSAILASDPDLGVVDIGAGIGVYTITAALMSRKVVAVEPLYLNFRLLHKSALENQVSSQITLVAQGIGAETYTGRINYDDSSGGYSQAKIEKLTEEEVKSAQNVVKVTTLNNLVQAVSFRSAVLKIDVGGYMEADLFESSSKFFSQLDVPYVLTHWNFHTGVMTKIKVASAMSRLGYQPRQEWDGSDIDPDTLKENINFLVWAK